MPKMKRAEFEVSAESDMGVERGVGFALKQIEQGITTGEHIIEKHRIFVKWTTFDIVEASPNKASILSGPDAPAPEFPDGPVVGAPVVPSNLPDISLMDIEEAKGVVGTAGSLEELDILLDFETKGERTPGGRAGVLKYIQKRIKEIDKKSSKA